MSNGIEVKGQKALIVALSKFNLDIRIAIDEAVRTTAFAVLKQAVKDIQTESKGEKVRSSESRRVHVASKVGDAPNTDTGRLVNSIQVSHNRGSQVAFVGSNLDYALFLEEDLDRPFLNPAKDKQAEQFITRIAEAISIQIAKADTK